MNDEFGTPLRERAITLPNVMNHNGPVEVEVKIRNHSGSSFYHLHLLFMILYASRHFSSWRTKGFVAIVFYRLDNCGFECEDICPICSLTHEVKLIYI